MQKNRYALVKVFVNFYGCLKYTHMLFTRVFITCVYRLYLFRFSNVCVCIMLISQYLWRDNLHHISIIIFVQVMILLPIIVASSFIFSIFLGLGLML